MRRRCRVAAPTPDLQASGQDPLAFAASTYARLHRLPDANQSRPHLVFTSPDLFVFEGEGADRQAGFVAGREQLGAATKGVRELGAVGDDAVLRRRSLIDHESATDGVVHARVELVTPRRRRPKSASRWGGGGVSGGGGRRGLPSRRTEPSGSPSRFSSPRPRMASMRASMESGSTSSACSPSSPQQDGPGHFRVRAPCGPASQTAPTSPLRCAPVNRPASGHARSCTPHASDPPCASCSGRSRS